MGAGGVQRIRCPDRDRSGLRYGILGRRHEPTRQPPAAALKT